MNEIAAEHDEGDHAARIQRTTSNRGVVLVVHPTRGTDQTARGFQGRLCVVSASLAPDCECVVGVGNGVEDTVSEPSWEAKK